MLASRVVPGQLGRIAAGDQISTRNRANLHFGQISAFPLVTALRGVNRPVRRCTKRSLGKPIRRRNGRFRGFWALPGGEGYEFAGGRDSRSCRAPLDALNADRDVAPVSTENLS